MEPKLFNPSLKNKKNPPQENLSYFGKIKLSNSNIKKLLTFSQKKAVIIFQESKTPKKLLIFSQEKAFLIFQERETTKQKIRIFQETALSYIS